MGVEPYPAVLFPDEATVVKVDHKKTTFNSSVVYALNKNNEWEKIDPTYLMDPIPQQYFPTIIYKLYDPAYLTSKKYAFFLKHHLIKKADNVYDGDQYFSKKLSNLNYNPYIIKIASYNISLDIETKKTTYAIVYEKLVHLHR